MILDWLEEWTHCCLPTYVHGRCDLLAEEVDCCRRSQEGGPESDQTDLQRVPKRRFLGHKEVAAYLLDDSLLLLCCGLPVHGKWVFVGVEMWPKNGATRSADENEGYVCTISQKTSPAYPLSRAASVVVLFY